MTDLRCTPAIEDKGQDEAETLQKIADTFAARRADHAGGDVCSRPKGGAASAAQWRNACAAESGRRSGVMLSVRQCRHLRATF